MSTQPLASTFDSDLLRALAAFQRTGDSSTACHLLTEAPPAALRDAASCLKAALRLRDNKLDAAVARAASKLGRDAAFLVEPLRELALSDRTPAAADAVAALGAIGNQQALAALEELLDSWSDRGRALQYIVPALFGRQAITEPTHERPTTWVDQLRPPLVIDLRLPEASSEHPEDTYLLRERELPQCDGLALKQTVTVIPPEGSKSSVELEIFNIPSSPRQHVVLLSATPSDDATPIIAPLWQSLEGYIEKLADAIRAIYSLPPEQTVWVERSIQGTQTDQGHSEELHTIPLDINPATGRFIPSRWTKIDSLVGLFRSLVRG